MLPVDDSLKVAGEAARATWLANEAGHLPDAAILVDSTDSLMPRRSRR
jgi:hypothetical protein